LASYLTPLPRRGVKRASLPGAADVRDLARAALGLAFAEPVRLALAVLALLGGLTALAIA